MALSMILRHFETFSRSYFFTKLGNSRRNLVSNCAKMCKSCRSQNNLCKMHIGLQKSAPTQPRTYHLESRWSNRAACRNIEHVNSFFSYARSRAKRKLRGSLRRTSESSQPFHIVKEGNLARLHRYKTNFAVLLPHGQLFGKYILR